MPPGDKQVWADELARAQARAIRRGQVVDGHIYTQYARAVEHLVAIDSEVALTASGGQVLRTKLREVFDQFTATAQNLTAVGSALTMQDVVAMHRVRTERLLADHGIKSSIDWQSANENVSKLLSRQREARDFRSLFKYRLDQNVYPQLDGLIDTAIVRGTSTAALTKSIAKTLMANDNRLGQLVNKGVAGQVATAEAVTANYARNLLYDARRIAVSEIMNTMRAANAAAMVEGGVVSAAKWQTSGRHAGLHSSPDGCDTLANQNIHGLGPGLYPPEAWPDAPHPMCACYPGAVEFKPVEDWAGPVKPIEPEAPPPLLMDADNFLDQKISNATGSNPGGVYLGKDGVKRYVKFYNDPAQAYGEQVANTLYRDLGHEAPESWTFQHEGKTAFASRILDNVKGTLATEGLTAERASAILDGFATDVLTANWDAIGLTLDNVVVLESGAVVRVDQGGSFLMRAQAGRKPLELLNKITEWDSFSNPSVNPSYAKVFKAAKVKSAEALGQKVISQIDDIVALRQKVGDWGKYVDDITLGGLNAVDRQRIVTMLDTRTALLAAKRVGVEAAIKAEEAAKIAKKEAAKAAKAAKKLAPSMAEIIPHVPAAAEARLAADSLMNDLIKTVIEPMKGKTVGFKAGEEAFSKWRAKTMSQYSHLPWNDPTRRAVEERIDQFSQTIYSWQAGSHDSIRNEVHAFMKGTQAATTNEFTLRIRKAYEDVATLVDNVDPKFIPKKLFRGFTARRAGLAQTEAYFRDLMTKGETVDLGLSSFSTSEVVAQKFHGIGTGEYGTPVRLVSTGQHRALGLQQFGRSKTYHSEREFIMGGRFQVTGVRFVETSRQQVYDNVTKDYVSKPAGYLEVQVRQAATWTPELPTH